MGNPPSSATRSLSVSLSQSPTLAQQPQRNSSNVVGMGCVVRVRITIARADCRRHIPRAETFVLGASLSVLTCVLGVVCNEIEGNGTHKIRSVNHTVADARHGHVHPHAHARMHTVSHTQTQFSITHECILLSFCVLFCNGTVTCISHNVRCFFFTSVVVQWNGPVPATNSWTHHVDDPICPTVSPTSLSPTRSSLSCFH